MGTVSFLLGDDVINLENPDPTLTVLDWLREHRARTGSKEGCAEGDCGACTVVLAEPRGEGLRYRAVNSCIQFLPTLHGKQLLTVEDLRSADGSLHPVQQALVQTHASQCGFCTPGFVMSLFALYQEDGPRDRETLDDTLAGNLCRCTGYRPIVDAALSLGRATADDPFQAKAAETVARLRRLRVATGNTPSKSPPQERGKLAAPSYEGEGWGGGTGETLSLQHGERRFFAPQDITQLAALYRRYPKAQLLAGGTDVGLWVTKNFQHIDTLIYLGEVAELCDLQIHPGQISLGAALSYHEAHATLVRYFPDLDELLRRLGSVQIRNLGTLGGNIANASPIGDSPPALLALGASLLLRQGEQTREIALADFFLEYRRTALQPGEFIQRIQIPLPVEGEVLRCYKISKRFDQDISALCGAFNLQLQEQRVVAARIAFGGMAATPKRAHRCEQALLGQAWNEATVAAGMAALAADFSPLSDFRASREYRQQVAANLLRKYYLETTGVHGLRAYPVAPQLTASLSPGS